MFIYRRQQGWKLYSVFHVTCPYTTATKISTSRKQTLYEVLDIPETATMGDIRDAFIKKSKESHPDMDPLKPELHDTFVKVNEAYNTLSNASSRREYDLTLGKTGSSSLSRANPFGSVPNHRQPSYSYYYEKATSSSNYRQSRTYGFTPPVANAAQKKNHNRMVIIGSFIFMITGAALSYFIIRSRHNLYRTRADEKSRIAQQLHAEAKERARTNGLKRQLEHLVAQHNGFQKVTARRILQQQFDDERK